MSKIDIDKFVVSLLNSSEIANKDKKIIHHALGDQGLRIKDGEIVSIEPDSQRMIAAEAKEAILPKRLSELESGKWYVYTSDNASEHGLTKGKAYLAVNIQGLGVTIENDYGTPLAINGFLQYLRPATAEEIPQNPQCMVSEEQKSEFKEKVDRLVELLKNNPQEQELQAEIHSWFEEPKQDPCKDCKSSDCGSCEHNEHEEIARIEKAMYKQKTSELTEFEETVRDVITSELCNNFGNVSFGISITNEEAKLIANKLLPVARKEIIKSIDTDVMVDVVKKAIENNPLGIVASLSIPGAYRMGINDAKNIIATKG